MLKYVIGAGLLAYEGETLEQAQARHRAMDAHNASVDRELAKWKPGPAKFYRKWCEKYAPHLLADDSTESP